MPRTSSNESKISKQDFFNEVDTDKQYRKKIYKDAKEILQQNFAAGNVAERFKHESILRISIPCAGSFPSADALIEVIKNNFPKLKTLELRLIDPDRLGLAVFAASHDELIQKYQDSLKIDVTLYEEDLQSFINRDIKSHIFIFEHSVVGAMNVLLENLRLGNENTLALRYAVPKMSRAFEENGVIMAICKSSVEIWQMKVLLSYSLGVEVQCTSRARSLVFPTDFCKGLSTTTKSITPIDTNTQHRRLLGMKINDVSLVYFITIGFYLYSLRFSKPGVFLEQTASLLLLFAQIFFHHPGKNGIALKCILCLSQAALLLREIDSNPKLDAANIFSPR